MTVFIFAGLHENIYMALGGLASLGVAVSMVAAWAFGRLVDRHKGDVLLMLVDEDKVPRLRSDDRFIVLSAREEVPSTPRKAWYAVGIMASVVLASGMHWLPIPAAAICSAVSAILP